jgi:hypothetical protein
MVTNHAQTEVQDRHVPILLNAAASIASETNAQTVIREMIVEALVIARMICVATKVNVMIYVLMVKLVAHAE